MRKTLKWLGIILGAILVVGTTAILAFNQPLPNGETGPEADALARQMLKAINKEAWDSTRYVSWSFPGGHHYIWDKFGENVQVEWGDNKVLLHTPTQTGKAWKGEQAQQGEKAGKLLEKAWMFFCNDSFWLNAPAKAFDPGTRLSLVKLENEKPGLLVSYSSGGTTPGDAYLWQLDEKGLPQRWKMWVSIIPIGGLAASWEKWETLETGAKLATRHKIGFITIELSNLRGGNSLQSIGLEQDPFQKLD